MAEVVSRDIYRFVSSVVQWRTGWVWAALFALVLTPVFGNKFGLAYLALSILSAYSIGAWLCSDTLSKKRSSRTLLHIPRGGVITDTHHYRRWQIIPSCLIALGAGIGLLYVHSLKNAFELSLLEGWLYPADEDVSVSCPVEHPDSDLVLLSGDNTTITKTFPYTVVAVNCEPVLQLDRDEKGRIAITLTIRDKEGRVVVDIERGYFEVNRNNQFHTSRDNFSTIRVIDQFKREALYMHLANRNTLQMRALFYYNGHPIRLGDSFALGHHTMSGNCSAYSGPELQIGDCLAR